MKHLIFSLGLGALLVSSVAAQTTPQERKDDRQDRRDDRKAARELQGRIVRTGNNQFVVQTRENKEVIVYTNPQTRYLLNNKAAQYSDFRVGSNVNFGYALEGERYIANNVTFVQPQIESPPNPAEDPARPVVGTAVEGKILRIVGKDQVIIQTSEGKEVIVYVTPQTAYQLETPTATFTDLRVGTPIMVNYDTRDNRFMARRFLRPRR